MVDSETQNGVRAPVSLFWFFLLSSFKNINLDVLKNLKKYVGVANVVLYRCVNFQNNIRYILGSVKMIKSHKKMKSSF
jgi:hypothetical protein